MSHSLRPPSTSSWWPRCWAVFTGLAEPGIMKRVTVRTVVTVAIVFVAVLALAPAADALKFTIHFKMSAKQLKTNCQMGAGNTASQTTDGTVTDCITKNGGTLICDDKQGGDNCTAQPARKRDTKSLVNEIRALGGTSVSAPSDSSKVWTQTVSLPTGDHGVAVLRDVVCSGLGGEFFANSDGVAGACRTPVAIVVCKDNQPGNNCTGFADTTKHAVATRKRIQELLATLSAGGPSGTPTGGGSTTTTHGVTATTHGTTPPTKPPPSTTPNTQIP
jgi:hypothetical protein